MNKFMIAVISIVIIGASCVPQKKYLASEDAKTKLQQEVAKLKRIQKDCLEMQKTKEQLEASFDAMTAERDLLANQLANLEKANDALIDRYDQLLDQNNNILTSSSEERQDLSEKLAQKQAELSEKERLLSQLDGELGAKGDELDVLRKSLDEREARITNLTSQLNAQKDVLHRLKSNLTDALLGFSDADLTVTQKNGKVYVSLSQNLLFAKGSTVIDAKGIDAIKKVALVLRENEDVDITVEGHTDSDGTAERNWDLSVSRATAVLAILTKNGVNPEQIIAAGRAFYAPKVENDTEANKSINRRTEIILSPRLSELFRLLNE